MVRCGSGAENRRTDSAGRRRAFGLDRDFGQEGHPEPLGRQPAQRRQGRRPQIHAGLRGFQSADFERLLGQAMPFFQQKQAARIQRIRRHAALPQPVDLRGRPGQKETVVEQRNLDQLVVARWAAP